MAPEQFESLANADARSDIFSFGAVLYELVTRRRPFFNGDAREMAKAGRRPLPLDTPDVPPTLGDIVRRCLEYDPARRYQSFVELLEVLEGVQAALPNPVPVRTHEVLPAFGGSDRAVGEVYSLISLGRHEAAADRASRAIGADREDPRHWINRGKALAELDRMDEARRADGYEGRRPEATALYQCIAEHWPEFAERLQEQGGLPKFVRSRSSRPRYPSRRELPERWRCRRWRR